jgi:hypothetical protein
MSSRKQPRNIEPLISSSSGSSDAANTNHGSSSDKSYEPQRANKRRPVTETATAPPASSSSKAGRNTRSTGKPPRNNTSRNEGGRPSSSSKAGPSIPRPLAAPSSGEAGPSKRRTTRSSAAGPSKPGPVNTGSSVTGRAAGSGRSRTASPCAAVAPTSSNFPSLTSTGPSSTGNDAPSGSGVSISQPGEGVINIWASRPSRVPRYVTVPARSTAMAVLNAILAATNTFLLPPDTDFLQLYRPQPLPHGERIPLLEVIPTSNTEETAFVIKKADEPLVIYPQANFEFRLYPASVTVPEAGAVPSLVITHTLDLHNGQIHIDQVTEHFPDEHLVQLLVRGRRNINVPESLVNGFTSVNPPFVQGLTYTVDIKTLNNKALVLKTFNFSNIVEVERDFNIPRAVIGSLECPVTAEVEHPLFPFFSMAMRACLWASSLRLETEMRYLVATVMHFAMIDVANFDPANPNVAPANITQRLHAEASTECRTSMNGMIVHYNGNVDFVVAYLPEPSTRELANASLLVIEVKVGVLRVPSDDFAQALAQAAATLEIRAAKKRREAEVLADQARARGDEAPLQAPGTGGPIYFVLTNGRAWFIGKLDIVNGAKRVWLSQQIVIADRVNREFNEREGSRLIRWITMILRECLQDTPTTANPPVAVEFDPNLAMTVAAAPDETDADLMEVTP